MAIKSGWDFESSHGFSGSAGKTMVKGYARGGKVGAPICKAKGGAIKTESVRTNFQQSEGAGKGGPDLNVKFAGNHLAYRKGGMVMKKADGGPIVPKQSLTAGVVRTAINRGVNGESFDRARVRVGDKRAKSVQGAQDAGKPINMGAPGDADDANFKKGGPIKRAAGGMTRPMGMPKAPVVGMKRMRHPPGMAGAGAGPKPMMPSVPGLPAAGSAPMGVPGKPGSPPRVMARGGKTNCGGD